MLLKKWHINMWKDINDISCITIGYIAEKFAGDEMGMLCVLDSCVSFEFINTEGLRQVSGRSK